MKKAVVARRYARALLDIGIEEKAYERFGQELRTVYGVFEGNPEAYRVLLNPMFKVEERKGFVESLSKAMGLSETVYRFLLVLVDRRHVKLIGDIAAAYSRLEDAAAGRVRATVESPFDLPEDILSGIKAKISELTGKDVLLAFSRNQSLLGGVLVRIENTLIDGSLRTQLDTMKERITGVI